MPHRKDTQATAQQIEWYRLPSSEALDRIGSSREGLAPEEAQKRLEEHGRNKLPSKEGPSLFAVAVRQFKSPLIYVLVGAGIISLAIGELTDAAFIFFVVLLNAVIGTIQEYKAEKSAQELQKMIQAQARVRRGGEEKQIDAELVIPGDIVLVESGSKIAADCRILASNNIGTDESILTGESATVEKHIDPIDAEHLEVGDQKNMLFAGTSVISGKGEAVVVGTGGNTQIGGISKAVTGTETGTLPLVQRMNRFVRNLSIVMLGAVVLLGILAFLRGTPLVEVFFMAVALAVSAIPEGLPVGMTVALAISVNRMAKRKAIVRKLAAVEGLGSCTYIASDKTGTLTSNVQTAKRLALAEGGEFLSVNVTGQGYAGEGTLETDDHQTPGEKRMARARAFARAATICNAGTLSLRDGRWQPDGDPIDVALLALTHKAGMDPSDIRSAIEITAEIPYESQRKYAATFYRDKDGTQRVAVKGATDTVLRFCARVPEERGEQHIDRDRIGDMEDALTGDGFRVLAVASGNAAAPEHQNPSEDDIPELTFLGLVGFIDPLRPEVRGAVEECRQAGIRVSMITGDHPRTALAIARNLGIAATEEGLATGNDLQRLKQSDPEAFNAQVRRATVFARINPLQKVDIVGSLVEAGEFVAVTGDGVNDAPALRKASIGIAMGSGNDVAKETGSIIIADDNFASIVAGVEEGRRAYHNLRKVIYLLISTGAAEVILFTLAILFGMPIPLVAVQLLWLNLVTNGIQHVALAFERGEEGVMEEPPRDPAEGIFNRLMIQETLLAGSVMALVAFGLWFWKLSDATQETPSRNLVLLLMVLFENYHAFNCRSETQSAFRVPLRRNLFLAFGVIAALGVHIVAMYVPFMQRLLGTRPVTFLEFGMVFALASTVLIANELYKLYQRRKHHRGSDGPGKTQGRQQ
jgi:magnesium-transporting ATPase (P-type)